MSLILAPYHHAMRLGMGFNSFTQSMCVDNVVSKPDGKQATENDLRSVPATGQPPTNKQAAMTGSSGTSVLTKVDGQMTISQTVSWEAKFVDKISEVTDSMNISGSLAIKIDAIGGGGAAEGHFIDSNKFKDSDINYHIHVKVTNQKLIADDITQFNPIRNVQPTQFTQTYGDSFVSGFLEGGEFNALVSVKLKDKSKLRDFGGGLKVSLGFTGLSVSGEAKGGKESKETSTDSETTISVSWSGGGDIKPNDITNWDIPSLKRVAMEFPDLVAQCPQRTSAILTKYTSLRSYYEQNLKGSPLDYENAGIYSNSLLDAYMDYKAIWKSLQTAIWEVDNGLSRLQAQETNDDLKYLAESIGKDFQKRSLEYKNRGKESETAIAKSKTANKAEEPEPLEPNKLAPYKSSVYGLDDARRDCRFEMIKIVREVDAVTHDPQVAIDPSRVWQYLSPVIFRKLIPIVRSIKAEEMELDIVHAQEQLANITKAWTDAKAAQQLTTDELNATKKKLQDTETSLAESTKNGEATRRLIAGAEDREKSLRTDYQNQLDAKEKSIRTELDRSTQYRADVERKNKELQDQRADVERKNKDLQDQLDKTKGVQVRRDGASSGLMDMSARGFAGGVNARALVQEKFPTPLVGNPRVLYGLSFVDCDFERGSIALSSDITELNQTGFKANPRSFNGCLSYGMTMSWLQLPDNGVHFEYGTWDTYNYTNPTEVSTTITFPRAFGRAPCVWAWFTEINKQGKDWFSLRVLIDSQSPTSFRLTVGTWAGRNWAGARVMWFAYDADEDKKRVFSGRDVASRYPDPNKKDTQITSQWSFPKKPSMFHALSELDFGMDRNLRARTMMDGDEKERRLTLGTWADSNMDHVCGVWLGMTE